MNVRQQKKLKKRGYFHHYKQYKSIENFFHELQTNKKIQDLFVNAGKQDVVVCELGEFDDKDLLDRLREETSRAIEIPKEMLGGTPFDAMYDEYRDTQYKIHQEFASIFKQHLKGLLK